MGPGPDGRRPSDPATDGGAGGSPGGTYTLVIAVDGPTTLSVGALGACTFDAPAYTYTGSALGAGGFARVDRHRRIAAGESSTRHWHVDYLLGAPEATLAAAVESPGADAECAVAGRLGDDADGFGCSDCDCRSHLAAHAAVGAATRAAVRAHESAVGTARTRGRLPE